MFRYDIRKRVSCEFDLDSRAGGATVAGPLFFFFEPRVANVLEANRGNNMGGAQLTWQEDL